MSGETAMHEWADGESQLPDDSQRPKKSKKANPILIGVGIALFLAIGAGAVWYDRSKNRAAEAAQLQQAAQQPFASEAASAVADFAQPASAAIVMAPAQEASAQEASASAVMIADASVPSAIPSSLPPPATGSVSNGMPIAAPATPMVPASEVAARDRTILDLQGEVSRLSAEVAELKTKLQAATAKANRPPVVKASPPKAEPKAEPNPVVADRREVKPKVNRDKEPAPDAKPRTDYRVYAIVEGQCWVVGKDGEPLLVRENAVLPDGSRVLRIDVKKHVVVTTGGTIS